MDLETEFYIKIALTFIAAGGIMFIMNRLQKRKEAEADRVFEWTLKSRGMSSTILEDQNDTETKK